MIRGLTMSSKAAATARLDLDSDESLVKRAREGDFDAFEVLFDRHLPTRWSISVMMPKTWFKKHSSELIRTFTDTATKRNLQPGC